MARSRRKSGGGGSPNKKLPLKDAAEGHRLVENKTVIGKIILEP